MEFAGSDGLLKVGEFELRVEHHLEIAAESLELGIGSLGIQNIVARKDFADSIRVSFSRSRRRPQKTDKIILDKLKGIVKCLEVTLNAKRELRKSLF